METYQTRTETVIELKGDDIPKVTKGGVIIKPHKVTVVTAHRTGKRFMIVTGRTTTGYARSTYFDVNESSSYPEPPRWLFQLLVKHALWSS